MKSIEIEEIQVLLDNIPKSGGTYNILENTAYYLVNDIQNQEGYNSLKNEGSLRILGKIGELDKRELEGIDVYELYVRALVKFYDYLEEKGNNGYMNQFIYKVVEQTLLQMKKEQKK